MAIKSRITNVIVSLNGRRDVWEFLNGGSIRTISRQRLFSLIAMHAEDFTFSLTPEEEADILAWNTQPIKLEVEDKFILWKFTWREMEQWMANCYRMHENPMRSLRRILEEHLSDAVYYINVFKCGEYPKSYRAGLTCVDDQRNPSNPSVKLVAYGTFDEIAREETDLEYVLKVAGIH